MLPRGCGTRLRAQSPDAGRGRAAKPRQEPRPSRGRYGAQTRVRGRDARDGRKVGNSHLWANEIVVRWGNER